MSDEAHERAMVLAAEWASQVPLYERIPSMERVAEQVLREEPERYKRERVYQLFELAEGEMAPAAQAAAQRLREKLGDTDDNRDTRSTP